MAADANIGATLNDVDGGIQVTATREDGSTHDSVMQLLHHAKIGSLVIKMFESSLIRKGISCREDLVEYFESIMGVPEETEEYCKLEDRISLPNGWRIMNESNRTYYVHLESLTVQLSPPKSGIVPGLHRQLCQFLELKPNNLNMWSCRRLQRWAMNLPEHSEKSETAKPFHRNPGLGDRVKTSGSVRNEGKLPKSAANGVALAQVPKPPPNLLPRDRVLAQWLPKLNGLTNLGNTCYMNAGLQCLLHTTELSHFFLRGFYKKDLNLCGNNLAESFSRLVDQTHVRTPNDGRLNESVSPHEVKTKLGRFRPQFKDFTQKDTQECILALLDGIHEDLNRVKNNVDVGKVLGDDKFVGDFNNDEDIANQSRLCHKKRNDSFIYDTFQSQMRSQLTCNKCNQMSVSFEPSMYLTLHVEEALGPTTLEALLLSHVAQEQLTGCNRWRCPYCKEDVEAYKQMNLWKTSDILIVHLKRFVPGNTDKRINTPVALPTEEVDFTPYFTPTSPFIENNKYRLYAVSNHKSLDGSALRGHCYAYCRPDDDKCWFMFDDSTVSGAELPVATPDAYVLFFRRVSGTPRNLQSLMESDERCQDGSTWIQELERLEAVSIPEAKAAVNMQEERSRKGDVIEPRLGAPKVAATKAKTAAKAKADTVANTETRHAAVSQESSSLENDVAAAKTALRIGNSIATTAVGFEVPSTSLALPSSPDMIGLGLHVDRVLQGFKVLQIIEGLGAHADGRIAVGDVISHVNGNLAPPTSDQLRHLLCGPVGSSVRFVAFCYALCALRPEIQCSIQVIRAEASSCINIKRTAKRS